MYTFIRFRNQDDEIVEFNSNPDPLGFITTEKIQHQIIPRASRRGKSEAHGSWATFTYYEGMTITLQGNIVAYDPAVFNQFLTDTMQKLMPDPLTPQSDRNQGTFIIQRIGSNAAWQIPASSDMPLQAEISTESYSSAKYQVIFYCPRPFYYEPKTNRYFWHP